MGIGLQIAVLLKCGGTSPEACSQRRDCALAPLRRFVVARGDTRQFAGLRDFTPCVATDARPLGPDCKPDPAQGAAAAAPR